MKKIRVLGIDDSYFKPHHSGKVAIVGVVMRDGNYIEGFLKRTATVDGNDITDCVMDMLNSKYRDQIKIIMTQGITFGGFNVLDAEAVYKETKVPVIVVSRRHPNIERIELALKANFEDWERRLKLIKNTPIEEMRNGPWTIYVQRVGIEKRLAEEIIRKFTVRGAVPEPIRVAHLLASALYFGESKGKP